MYEEHLQEAVITDTPENGYTLKVNRPHSKLILIPSL